MRRFTVNRLLPSLVRGTDLTIEECEFLLTKKHPNRSLDYANAELVREVLRAKTGIKLFPLQSTIQCLKLLNNNIPSAPLQQVLHIIEEQDHYGILSKKSLLSLIELSTAVGKIDDIKKLIYKTSNPNEAILPKYKQIMGIEPKPTQHVPLRSAILKYDPPDEHLLSLLRNCKHSGNGFVELLTAAAGILLERHPESYCVNITSMTFLNVSPSIVKHVAAICSSLPHSNNLIDSLVWITPRMQTDFYPDVRLLSRRVVINSSTDIKKIELIWENLLNHKMEVCLDLTIKNISKKPNKRNQLQKYDNKKLCSPNMLYSFVTTKEMMKVLGKVGVILDTLVKATGEYIINRNRKLILPNGKVIQLLFKYLSRMDDSRLTFEVLSTCIQRSKNLSKYISPKTAISITQSALSYCFKTEVLKDRAVELVVCIIKSCCIINNATSDRKESAKLYKDLLYSYRNEEISSQLKEIATQATIATERHGNVVPMSVMVLQELLKSYLSFNIGRGMLPSYHFNELFRAGCCEYLLHDLPPSFLIKLLYRLALLRHKTQSSLVIKSINLLLQKQLSNKDVNLLVWSSAMMSVTSDKNLGFALSLKVKELDFNSFSDVHFLRIIWSYSFFDQTVRVKQVIQRIKERTLSINILPVIYDGVVDAFQRLQLSQTELQIAFQNSLDRQPPSASTTSRSQVVHKKTKLDDIILKFSKENNLIEKQQQRNQWKKEKRRDEKNLLKLANSA